MDQVTRRRIESKVTLRIKMRFTVCLTSPDFRPLDDPAVYWRCTGRAANAGIDRAGKDLQIAFKFSIKDELIPLRSNDLLDSGGTRVERALQCFTR